jgi:hypothetical protein
MAIERAFVVYPPPLTRHSTTDRSEDLNAMSPFRRIWLSLSLVITIRVQKGLIVSLADTEIVFGDSAAPLGNQTLLHETLAVGAFFQLRLPDVIVPESTGRKRLQQMNRSLSFLECVAKNISIRRDRTMPSCVESR